MSMSSTIDGRAVGIQKSTATLAVAVLAILTALGVVAGLWRLALGLGATTALTDDFPWGIWIGFDFGLIAMSGIAFTMVAVVHVFRMEKFHELLRPAVLAGLMGYVAVLLLLFLDLGRPDRFYGFLIFWNVHSPLFEVSWCIFLYSMVLFLETAPLGLERFKMEGLAKIVHRVVMPLAIIGIMLSSLHQSTLGTLFLNMEHRLHALWYSPIMPFLFFVSSIMAGLAMGILVYGLATRIAAKEAKPEIPTGLAKGAAWVALVYAALKLLDLVIAGEMGALFAFDGMSLLMLLELGVCTILPMLLFFNPSMRASAGTQKVGAILILGGVLLNRFSATLFAQSVREGATYTPHILEWISTVGVIAGAILAWCLGVRFLASFESAKEH